MASQLITTEGYDCYWVFASARQQIYYKRLAGLSKSCTSDSILSIYRFTNPYRASDRVSQYLINEVQYNQKWDWQDTFVRTLLFKIFNRIDTWQHICSQIGEPDCSKLFDKSIDKALALISDKRPIYSAAYMMPPPTGFTGSKYVRHLELLRQMIIDGVPDEIKSAQSMEAAFKALRSYNSIGDFLAYQLITDLNYSSHLSFSETAFVVAGPGSQRGLRKCFANYADFTDEYLIRWTFERQEREFTSRNLPWQGLFGRPLQLIDIQNLFCEVDKYTRIALPQLSVYAPGQRIKQRYRVNSRPLTAWFPPKWGINEAGATIKNSV